MPKKRSTVYAKPSSSTHPSLLSGDKATSHASSDSNAEVRSVNDRLQQLRLPRKGDGSKPFEAPPAHTVHPSLQAILQIPDAPPPRPRPGLRVAGGRRGLAGPPPPDSWLARRSTERSKLQSTFKNGRKAPTLPGYDLPESDTLLCTSLKQLAQEWDFHIEYDQHYLATLPVRYKELLLHFIALHKPCAIDHASLERLFLDEFELEGGTGAEDLSRLDLSTSIGRSLTLKDLKAFFTPRGSVLRVEISKTNPDVTASSSPIPESWDAAPLLQPTATRLPPRFTTLTHLSLSCPPPTISWSHLLNHLLPHLPSQSLSHLSLAFWPFPTLTPNSLVATSFSPAGAVQAGGSNFYSCYDSDWTEPALILRRVARATLGLQWLDLTGNWPWMQALADEGFDWSGGGLWAGLETLVVGQGWVPECFAPSHPHCTGCEGEIDGVQHITTHSASNTVSAHENGNGKALSTKSLASPWREQYPFIGPCMSVVDSAKAYEAMCSNSDRRSLLEWAKIEHASLAFEQIVKAKLKRAVVMSPSFVHNDKEDDNWIVPKPTSARTRPRATAETAIGNSNAKGENDEYRHKTSQRRKGITFERGWSEKWVTQAIEEISTSEGILSRHGIRTMMR